MSRLTIILSFVVLLQGNSEAVADLATRVEVNQLGTTFIYTVFNDEPLGSPNFINLFFLNVAAPITITSTPPGWEYSTDNATFVSWMNSDVQLSFPDDIPPQDSVTFSIESNVTTTELLGFTVASWDHMVDGQGPAYRDQVLAPSSIQAIPEPSSFRIFGVAAIMGLAGWKWCVWKRPRNYEL
jgi:hypothetical protein